MPNNERLRVGLVTNKKDIYLFTQYSNNNKSCYSSKVDILNKYWETKQFGVKRIKRINSEKEFLVESNIYDIIEAIIDESWDSQRNSSGDLMWWANPIAEFKVNCNGSKK